MGEAGRVFEDMAAYRAAAQWQWLRRQQASAERRAHALALAGRAAALLKETFGASRVVLFGSLARGGPFDVRSDIDLAVWGLDESEYYRAVSRVLDLDPAVEIDVLMAEEAPPALLKAIDDEGVPL